MIDFEQPIRGLKSTATKFYKLNLKTLTFDLICANGPFRRAHKTQLASVAEGPKISK